MFSQKPKPRQVKIKYQEDVTAKLRVINAFGFLMAFQNSGTLWNWKQTSNIYLQTFTIKRNLYKNTYCIAKTLRLLYWQKDTALTGFWDKFKII